MSVLKRKNNLESLLVKDSSDASDLVGLDNDEMRDTVMTMAAMDPKSYMEFRNAALYGSPMSAKNPLKSKMSDTDLSIKNQVKEYYNEILKSITEPKSDINRGVYEGNPLSAFLPPYDTIIELPPSKRKQMAYRAFEQSYRSKVREFNAIYPAKISPKLVDSEGFATPHRRVFKGT